MTQALREQMRPLINLRYPHFEKHNEVFGTNNSYGFEEISCPNWYQEMVSQILEAMTMHEFIEYSKPCGY